MRVIVLGCEHSGVRCLANALISQGIPRTVDCGLYGLDAQALKVTDEGDLDVGIFASVIDHPDYGITNESVYEQPFTEGARVVHLVRNPLNVIRSWREKRLAGHASLNAPEAAYLDARAADWVAINERIEDCGERPYGRYRIEDGPEAFFAAIGHPGVKKPPWGWSWLPLGMPSDAPLLTWDRFPGTNSVSRAREMAARYGYH